MDAPAFPRTFASLLSFRPPRLPFFLLRFDFCAALSLLARFFFDNFFFFLLEESEEESELALTELSELSVCCFVCLLVLYGFTLVGWPKPRPLNPPVARRPCGTVPCCR